MSLTGQRGSFAVAAAILLAAAFLSSCGGGGTSGSFVPPVPGPGEHQVAGAVSASDGQRVAGATVSIVGTALSDTTDSQGMFYLNSPPPGNQTLVISRTGYQTTYASVLAVDGKTSVEVVADPVSVVGGSVSVSSNPAGASIQLDGAAQGSNTNATLTGLAPGPHTITLTMPGKEDLAIDVNVPSAGSLALPAFWLADSFSADADKAAVSARAAGLDAAYSNMDIGGYMSFVSAVYADAEAPSYDDLQTAIQENFGFFETLQKNFWNTDIIVAGNTAWVSGFMISSGRYADAGSPTGYSHWTECWELTQTWVNEAGAWMLASTQKFDGAYAWSFDMITIGTTTFMEIGPLPQGAGPAIVSATAVGANGLQPINFADYGGYFSGQHLAPYLPGDSGLYIQATNANGAKYVFSHPVTYQQLPDPPSVSLSFGRYGFDPGQLNDPIGITVDSGGNIYVAEGGNDRISKFNSAGKYLKSWGLPGEGAAFFEYVTNIAADSSDNIYACDYSNHRVKVFDEEGTPLQAWGSPGSGAGQFNAPSDVAIDSSDNVYVADRYNDRIQVFDTSGRLIDTFAHENTSNPADLAIDQTNGLLYMASRDNINVTKMNAADGALIGFLGNSFGKKAFDGFENILSLDVDADGNLYVCDAAGAVPVVKMFDANGNFITRWGGRGTAEGLFDGWCFIRAVDPQNIYITDSSNNRVQKFSFPAGAPRKAGTGIATAALPVPAFRAWDTGGGRHFKPK